MFHHDIGSLAQRAPRELAFLRATFAAARDPALALQAIAAIGTRGAVRASALAHDLGIDMAATRRLIRALVDAGEVMSPMGTRADATPLRLTAQGRRTWASLQDIDRQVSRRAN